MLSQSKCNSNTRWPLIVNKISNTSFHSFSSSAHQGLHGRLLRSRQYWQRKRCGRTHRILVHFAAKLARNQWNHQNRHHRNQSQANRPFDGLVWRVTQSQLPNYLTQLNLESFPFSTTFFSVDYLIVKPLQGYSNPILSNKKWAEFKQGMEVGHRGAGKWRRNDR